MKIVAVTDIHGNKGSVVALAKVIEDLRPELILIAGDITHFGDGKVAEQILEPLLRLNIRVLAIMGNCDGRDVPRILERLGINVHNKRVKVKETGVVGLGGSNVTPFSTIWEFSDDEIYSSLKKNYKQGDIVLTHSPPYNTKLDRTFSGVHAGSKGLRMFLEEEQPPICICGHIHEARGIDEIGDTVIVNPGPLSRGYYAIVDTKTWSVELERL
ncbi:metallophosphoesterase [Pyrococcus abyssi]|uniref:Metallophosphoesterase, calcineurin superfamily n=1 Tax=Pyrococcus abyssi (strain GE5 / Orsay) TaxID=272844 RepID=Q9UY46_PYRAB|nr:metallophosphoesterase [Pyrococcus abyssi]CAB50566.1 Serine/threonine-specific protein phosphatase, putative [Pyrococcus abyssi GE5]CCE71130.1 TPA: Metallophosphoesterase, calcineurin superfamily [Pyrococcus abyssi GE5]